MNRISDSMFHSRSTACKKPYGTVPAGQAVEFSVYPQRAQGALQVTLWIEEDGCQAESHPLHWCGYQGSHDRYTVTYTPPHPGLYWYYFSVELADGLHYCARGYGGQAELLEAVGDKYQLTVYDGEYHTPRWFGEGITYNIFPDRFCRDKAPEQPESEGVVERVLHQNWDDIPVYLPDEHGEILNNDFFGGTLRGVYAKLDYLESLHVTTIYFNPIFQAYSNHRYDTGDYKRIAPLLGCEEDFRALCSEAARRGMRVVLDGVFNHTGSDSLYFNKEGRYGPGGAYRDPRSPYRSWYCWKDAAANMYESWWGFQSLPKLNSRDESWREFLCGENGIVRHWLRLGADGWRLDVVDEYPDELVRMIRQAARAEKPDALIIGEVWEDASCKEAYGEHRQYLMGHELDSVMNYPLRQTILDFLLRGDGAAFRLRLWELLEHYPRPCWDVMMNLLSSHDVPRAITALGGTPMQHRDRDWQRAHNTLTVAQYYRGRQLFMLGTLMTMTLPGMPCLYYGDEAGLVGYADPFNRGTYPWGREDTGLRECIRQMAALRNGNSALSAGELEPLVCAAGMAAWRRRDETGEFIICVNPGEGPLPLPDAAKYGETVFTIGQAGERRLEGQSAVIRRIR